MTHERLQNCASKKPIKTIQLNPLVLDTNITLTYFHYSNSYFMKNKHTYKHTIFFNFLNKACESKLGKALARDVNNDIHLLKNWRGPKKSKKSNIA